MFRRADPLKHKLLRGAVMRTVYLAVMGSETPINAEDPMTLPRGVLARILELNGLLPVRSELNAAVRYLSEKGYLEAAYDEEGEFTRVRLTTRGIDLVEGTLRDEGILLPRA
ncbi:hypothetical protein [Thermus hydrothermalis]|uniref:hypothetical protein n=1 Tax=Thermus hydrothermalis TaxID=2908148 RepID=UPI001FAA3BA1|nr:hypothetical protein [Thermus hydrothermalis]